MDFIYVCICFETSIGGSKKWCQILLTSNFSRAASQNSHIFTVLQPIKNYETLLNYHHNKIILSAAALYFNIMHLHFQFEGC
jgi:hypothetical protein